MSATPFSPPMVMSQEEASAGQARHGSVGPVIGVLAVIAVLGAIAVMIGRLCSGRKIMGRGQYDFESWMETKCASCIDGRVSVLPPRVVVVAESSTTSRGSAGGGRNGAAAEEAPEGTKEEEEMTNQQQQQQAAAVS